MKRWFTYVCIIGLMGISGLACQKKQAATPPPVEPTNVEQTETTATTTTAPAVAPTATPAQ